MPECWGPWCICQAHRLHRPLLPARRPLPLPHRLAWTLCSGWCQTLTDLCGKGLLLGLSRIYTVSSCLNHTFSGRYFRQFVVTERVLVLCFCWCIPAVFCLFFPHVVYQGCDNLSLSDHLLRAVLNLLRREVSEHGRHLQQYFNLFVMYANLGKKHTAITQQSCTSVLQLIVQVTFMQFLIFAWLWKILQKHRIIILSLSLRTTSPRHKNMSWDAFEHKVMVLIVMKKANY